MTNALTTIDYSSQELLTTLRNTVAVGATVAEFEMFVQFCKSTGLNPFKKEIWFIKDQQSGRLQMMTGINGFWTLANSFPEFDGAETGMISATGEWVKSVPDGSFIGAWCRVYRKDRRIPQEGEALLADYKKPRGMWTSAPRIMIKKVAESIALRKAFPSQLNGLYTAEEMPAEYQPPRFEGKTVEIFEDCRTTEPEEVHTEAKANGYVREAVTIADAIAAAPKAPTRKGSDHIAQLTTFYDTGALEGEAKEKAEAYLTHNLAERVRDNFWRSRIRLKKLTQCIVPEEAIEEGKQDDFPNI